MQAFNYQSLLLKENQKKLFVGFKNQPALSFKAESIHSGEKYECGQKYGCLVQHQIIPTYYFHSNYGALAICTLMNTVPIWESVIERINIVDKYLYAIAQVDNCNKIVFLLIFPKIHTGFFPMH